MPDYDGQKAQTRPRRDSSGSATRTTPRIREPDIENFIGIMRHTPGVDGVGRNGKELRNQRASCEAEASE